MALTGPAGWRTRRRLLAASVVIALVGCAVAAGLGWRWYTGLGPHVRDDLPTVRQAVADALSAAGNGAAVSIGEVVRVRTCSPRPLRTGGIYSLTADMYVDTAGEDALIGAVAERLPARYRPERSAPLAGSTRPMTADAGRHVQLAVRQLGDGWVTITATTGCRSGPSEQSDAALPDSDPAVTTVSRLLDPVGATVASVRRYELRCANGSSVVTIAGISRRTNANDLPVRFPVPADASRAALNRANRIAYRTGRTSVIIGPSDDGTAITVQHTTGC